MRLWAASGGAGTTIALAWFAVVAPQASAMPGCPRPSAQAPKDERVRYKERGNRCEGLYAVPVASGSSARIIGFHRQNFPDAAFSTIKETILSIQPPTGSGAIALRAVSLRPKTYYAMDTDLGAGQLRYGWDTSILSSPSLSMRASELGVVACDNRCLPSAATRYFPVNLDVPGKAEPKSGFVLIFQADATLENVRVVLRDQAGTVVLDRTLPGRFVASWPITTRIGFPKPGRYAVKFEGRSTLGPRILETYTIQIP